MMEINSGDLDWSYLGSPLASGESATWKSPQKGINEKITVALSQNVQLSITPAIPPNQAQVNIHFELNEVST